MSKDKKPPQSETRKLDLTPGRMGYAMDWEQRDRLEECGQDSELVLRQFRDSFPKFNQQADPLGVVDILDQGQQGSCQGHALAQVFSICYFLATGRREAFSRAAGYYLSQQRDGIRGDKGSTLSGGQWVATQHGLCLESDWPYPSRYNPGMPPSATNKFLFKLQTTKPFKDFDSMAEWLDQGLPIQIGLDWGPSCDKEIVDNYKPGGGGHSTVFWQRRASGNVVNINSWGRRWAGDGVHEWTPDSIKRALSARWTVFIGYAPAGMSFPNPKPLS